MPNPVPNLQSSPQPSVSQAIQNPMGATADPNSPPQATVTPVQQHQGPVKTFLSSFLYGGGQALLAHVGLPTDADKQQVAFQQQQDQQKLTLQQQQASVQQQNANDLSEYRKAQTGNIQAKADQHGHDESAFCNSE